MHATLLAAAPPSAVTSDGKGLLGALIIFVVVMTAIKILGALLRLAKS